MSIATWCTVGACIFSVLGEILKSFEMKHEIKEEMDKYDIKKKEVEES